MAIQYTPTRLDSLSSLSYKSCTDLLLLFNLIVIDCNQTNVTFHYNNSTVQVINDFQAVVKLSKYKITGFKVDLNLFIITVGGGRGGVEVDSGLTDGYSPERGQKPTSK